MKELVTPEVAVAEVDVHECHKGSTRYVEQLTFQPMAIEVPKTRASASALTVMKICYFMNPPVM